MTTDNESGSLPRTLISPQKSLPFLDSAFLFLIYLIYNLFILSLLGFNSLMLWFLYQPGSVPSQNFDINKNLGFFFAEPRGKPQFFNMRP